MDLSLTSEQTLLRDASEHFARKSCGFDQYLKSLASPGGCDPALWNQLAELGWLGLAIPEAAGGLGGSTLDLALVAESLGAGMAIEPFVSGVVAPVHAIVAGGAAEAQAELLGRVMAGEAQLALACTERGGRFLTRHCATRAQRTGSGYVLSGAKQCVFNAPGASHLVVSARSAGECKSAQGIELFVVPKDSAGLRWVAYEILGGGCAAEVVLEGVEVPASARIVNGHRALEAALDRTLAVSCAQALGAMRALLARTRDYLQTRKQFGVPIGSFQVLQHRLVDMSIEIEQSQSLVMYASALADGADAQQRGRAASAAKAYLHKASKFVAQQAVQLHGGIGVTEELDVGHYFRQLTAFGTAWGDRAFHLARFGSLAVEGGTAAEPASASAAGAAVPA